MKPSHFTSLPFRRPAFVSSLLIAAVAIPSLFRGSGLAQTATELDGGIAAEELQPPPGEPVSADAGVVDAEIPSNGLPDGGVDGPPADEIVSAAEPKAVETVTPGEVFEGQGSSLFWSTRPGAGAEIPSGVDFGAVWVEPLGSFFMGAAGFSYFSFGANVALTSKIDLVLEGAVTLNGNWYGCGTTSDGAFGAIGVAFRFGADSSYNGFFLQPKLHFRRFETSGGAPTDGWFGKCTDEDVRGLRDWDADFGVGLDLGYQFKWGPLFVAPLIGFTLGACFNCVGGNFFHFDFDLFQKNEPRQLGLGAGLNLNLLRVGIAF